MILNDIAWTHFLPWSRPLPSSLPPWQWSQSRHHKHFETTLQLSAIQLGPGVIICFQFLQFILSTACMAGLGRYMRHRGLTSHRWTLELGCQSDRSFPGIVTIAPVEILTPSQANCLAAFAWRSIFTAINKEIWTSAPVRNTLKLSLNFHSKVLLGSVLLTVPATTSVQSSLVSGSRNQEPWRILEIVFGSLLLNWLHL